MHWEISISPTIWIFWLWKIAKKPIFQSTVSCLIVENWTSLIQATQGTSRRGGSHISIFSAHTTIFNLKPIRWHIVSSSYHSAQTILFSYRLVVHRLNFILLLSLQRFFSASFLFAHRRFLYDTEINFSDYGTFFTQSNIWDLNPRQSNC